MLQAKNVGSRAEIAEQFLGRLLDAGLELQKREFFRPFAAKST